MNRTRALIVASPAVVLWLAICADDARTRRRLLTRANDLRIRFGPTDPLARVVQDNADDYRHRFGVGPSGAAAEVLRGFVAELRDAVWLIVHEPEHVAMLREQVEARHADERAARPERERTPTHVGERVRHVRRRVALAAKGRGLAPWVAPLGALGIDRLEPPPEDPYAWRPMSYAQEYVERLAAARPDVVDLSGHLGRHPVQNRNILDAVVANIVAAAGVGPDAARTELRAYADALRSHYRGDG